MGSSALALRLRLGLVPTTALRLPDAFRKRGVPILLLLQTPHSSSDLGASLNVTEPPSRITIVERIVVVNYVFQLADDGCPLAVAE